MTAQALNDALAELGWPGVELGRRLGKGEQQVSAWRTGKAPVPAYVAEYLRAMLLVKKALDR